MRIRLIREWKGNRAGRILDMPDGAANVLIKRQFAEVADTPARECAMLPPAQPRKQRR